MPHRHLQEKGATLHCSCMHATIPKIILTPDDIHSHSSQVAGSVGEFCYSGRCTQTAAFYFLSRPNFCPSAFSPSSTQPDLQLRATNIDVLPQTTTTNHHHTTSRTTTPPLIKNSSTGFPATSWNHDDHRELQAASHPKSPTRPNSNFLNCHYGFGRSFRSTKTLDTFY